MSNVAQLQRVVHPSRGASVGVRTPYSQSLVDELKRALPHGTRGWDPTVRAWFVDVAHERTLVDALARVGFDVAWTADLFPAMDPITAPEPKADPWGRDYGTSRPPRPPKRRPDPGPAKAPAQDDRFYSRRYATDEDWATLHLLPDAPLPVAKAAYQAMMRMNHPDQGGTSDAAQRVNVAWQRIERQLSESA